MIISVSVGMIVGEGGGGSVAAAAAAADVVIVVNVAPIVIVAVQRYRSTLIFHAATLQAHDQREKVLIRNGSSADGIAGRPPIAGLGVHRDVWRWQFRALLLDS